MGLIKVVDSANADKADLEAVESPVPRKQVYVLDYDYEHFERYIVGGFHPTVIGDTFDNGRYEVVHKLGHGAYSTTWLARDKKRNHYVALKIVVASETPKSTEADILRLLSHPIPFHRGQAFVMELLDEFVIEGPNGRHICLVSEVAACDISTSKETSGMLPFPAETARSIVAQLILGLSYLHSRKVCHGGMITLSPGIKAVPSRQVLTVTFRSSHAEHAPLQPGHRPPQSR
jgi:hypothetical protein